MSRLRPDLTTPQLRLLEVARRLGPSIVCVRVERYDAQATTADVTPIVRDWRTGTDGARLWVEQRRIDGCPVLWPGGGTRGLTMGLEAGDLCLAVSRSVSHDEIDAGGTTPAQPRGAWRHGISDAIVLPGYVVPANGRAASEYRSDGQPVLYMDAGEALHVAVSTAAIALARADLVHAELQAVQAGLNNHTHAAGTLVAPSGGGPVTGATAVGGSYTAPATASDIATDRVKVDS